MISGQPFSKRTRGVSTIRRTATTALHTSLDGLDRQGRSCPRATMPPGIRNAKAGWKRLRRRGWTKLSVSALSPVGHPVFVMVLINRTGWSSRLVVEEAYDAVEPTEIIAAHRTCRGSQQGDRWPHVDQIPRGDRGGGCGRGQQRQGRPGRGSRGRHTMASRS